MKISDPNILAAWDQWWAALTRQGDPIRRPDLTAEAFVAGWLAAKKQTQDATDKIRAALDEMHEHDVTRGRLSGRFLKPE